MIGNVVLITFSTIKSKTDKNITLIRETLDMPTNNVFSTEREVKSPSIDLPDFLKPNSRLKMDGVKFLSHLPHESIPVAFLDPQYRGVLDKMNYGNEGKSWEKRRCSLIQMTEEIIKEFIRGINNVLIHLDIYFCGLISFIYAKISITGLMLRS